MVNKSVSSISLGILSVILLPLLSSCASSGGSLVSNAYHNTTSHYNGYWYARESIKTIENQIDESIENDYDHILPLFPVIDTTLAKSYSEQSEDAIKMASLFLSPNLIRLDHSTFIGLSRALTRLEVPDQIT